MKLWKQTRS